MKTSQNKKFHTAPKVSVKIHKLKLNQVRVVRDLFRKAAANHFDYLSSDYQQRILRDNSIWRLAAATVRPSRLMYVAVRDARVVGYVFGSVPSDGRGQLYWLYVEPDIRDQNVGLALLAQMLRGQQEKGAHLTELVTYAYEPYYARQGFKVAQKVMIGGAEHAVMQYSLRGSGNG